MAYYENVAPKKRQDGDTVARLLETPSPMQASNQVRFTQPDSETYPANTVGNIEKQQANTKGTGKEGVESSIALAPKRRLAVKMPANY